jgi:hypothetical protein
MNYTLLPYLLSLFLAIPNTEVKTKTPTILANNIEITSVKKTDYIYNNLNAKNFKLPHSESFTKALEGFYLLKEKGLIKKDILTLVDFSMPSSSKRLWVIDLATNTILYNSLVSHGMNSGGEYANSFSNAPNSNKSSLGFYATAESYIGKHGLSLKLDGLEKGLNSNARSRDIVIHGAQYANPSILDSQNFLGRSQGCPALPEGLSKQIINTIKNKSCLYIYHPCLEFKKSPKLIS